jgi:hypothetical protein
MTATEPPEPVDGDTGDTGDAAAMLELVRAQQDLVNRRMAAQVPAILLAWGIAWTVGFGLLWLIDGAKPAIAVPLPVAVISFVVLMAGALVATAILGIRSGRGIRSTTDAAFTGAVYGMTWTVGFVAIVVFGTALIRNGMAPELANIYYPTASTLFVGIMYLIAGGIWRTWGAIGIGAWIILVALIAPFFGYPTHYLVFAIAGGGVFLAGALVAWLWVRR